MASSREYEMPPAPLTQGQPYGPYPTLPGFYHVQPQACPVLLDPISMIRRITELEIELRHKQHDLDMIKQHNTYLLQQLVGPADQPATSEILDIEQLRHQLQQVSLESGALKEQIRQVEQQQQRSRQHPAREDGAARSPGSNQYVDLESGATLLDRDLDALMASPVSSNTVRDRSSQEATHNLIGGAPSLVQEDAAKASSNSHWARAGPVSTPSEQHALTIPDPFQGDHEHTSTVSIDNRMRGPDLLGSPSPAEGRQQAVSARRAILSNARLFQRASARAQTNKRPTNTNDPHESIFDPEQLMYRPAHHDTDVFRTVLATQIPPEMSIDTLLSFICGGPLVSIRPTNTITICRTKTVLITFLEENSARAFVAYATMTPDAPEGVQFRLLDTPTWPLSTKDRHDMTQRRRTRCLSIGGLDASVQLATVSNALAEPGTKPRTILSSFKSADDQVSLFGFTSVDEATRALEQARWLPVFRGARLEFAADPCDRPIPVVESGMDMLKEGV